MTRQIGTWRGLMLLVAALGAGCADKKPAPGVTESWDNVCVDMDGDGYGFQCTSGEDCDDGDKQEHDSCTSCRKPAEGCACDEGIEPVDCRLPYTLDTSGSLLCHTGTRYCRDGVWSACEGVVTFALPPGRRLTSNALLDPSEPPIACNPICEPDCYRAEDKLDTPFGPDAGVGTFVVSPDAGGVTIQASNPGPAYPEAIDDPACVMNDETDCDGLPSPYDPDSASADAGTHKVAFFDLPPGTRRTKTFQAQVGVKALDVYLYPGTGSDMGGPLSALRTSLTSGNFLPSAGTGINCADSNGDGSPDNVNKLGGIAGNVRCFVPDTQFGAGWFRDIPFYGPLPETGVNVAPWDTEMFDHRHDLSADVSAVRSVVGSFVVRDSLNPPEAAMQGLWALATGQGFYAGWDRPGVLPRSGCPAGSFGYPCFRDAALPVVLLISGVPMQNGPGTSAHADTTPATPANCLGNAYVDGDVVCPPLAYAPSVLSVLTAGTEGQYRTLTTTAEDLASAEPVGVIDDTLITYAGDLRAFRADVSYGSLGFSCGAWSGTDEAGPDALFRFHVDTFARYVLSARGSRFDATLALFQEDTSGGVPGPLTFRACSDDTVTVGHTSEFTTAPEISMDLAPGDYVLVLKSWGTSATLVAAGINEVGAFQVSLGRRTRQQPGVFQAKTWLGTGGVEEALRAKGIRVATLQVGSDAYLEEQALKLAAATGAVDGAGTELRGTIGLDGSDLGSEAVRVLRQIVDNAKLDVTLDLGQTSGEPNPGFGFVVEAIEQAGNGCNGVVDTDGDPAGLPDMHVDCSPDARPQFRVSLDNPAGGAAVPPNPADPNGGYFMWMRVLGDRHLVMDRVRVYVTTDDVFGSPGPVSYQAAGVYEQEVRANACADNEGPVWGALNWDAQLPEGTQISFEACAAQTSETLADCTFHPVLTLTPGTTTCSPGSAECGAAGYCDATGTCIEISGPSCMVNEDCGAFGACLGVAGALECTNTREALDLHPVAKVDMQGRRFARVRMRLSSSADRAHAPTLLGWSIDYRCAPRE